MEHDQEEEILHEDINPSFIVTTSPGIPCTVAKLTSDIRIGLPLALITFVIKVAAHLPFFDNVEKERMLNFLSNCMKDPRMRGSLFFRFRFIKPVINFGMAIVRCYEEGDAMPRISITRDHLQAVPRTHDVILPTVDQLREMVIDLYHLHHPRVMRQRKQWRQREEMNLHFLMLTHSRLGAASPLQLDSVLARMIMDIIWESLGD